MGTLRLHRAAPAALVACLAASAGGGCGSDGGLGPAADAGVLVGDLPAALPDLTKGSGNPDLAGLPSLPVTIGPIMLAPGQERTVCSIVRLGNATDIDVLRIDAKLLPGSHHLIFYKSSETVERPQPFDCDPLDIGFGGGNPKAVPLYIAETENDNGLPLPRGTAFHLPANQMVKLEAHYLNASPKTMAGQGTVTLTTAPPGDKTAYVAADIMFCGSVLELYTRGVPPGASSLSPGFFKPQNVVPGIRLFGLTAHQHKRGTQMTISRSTSAQDEGELLVDGRPWDNEPFVTWDDDHLLTFGPDQGLRWQCHYNNPDNFVVKFGESAATDEMCFLWGYYFPSAGHFVLQECLR